MSIITDLGPYQRSVLSANTVANIAESSTHKMAAKINWHRYESTLRHCHCMCTAFTCLLLLMLQISGLCAAYGARSGHGTYLARQGPVYRLGNRTGPVSSPAVGLQRLHSSGWCLGCLLLAISKYSACQGVEKVMSRASTVQWRHETALKL